MRKYNVENYVRYKTDIANVLTKDLYESEDFKSMSRDQLIIKFLPLVENIAKKFSTAQPASAPAAQTLCAKDPTKNTLAVSLISLTVLADRLASLTPSKLLAVALGQRMQSATACRSTTLSLQG